jgi:hypothetical protein
MSARDVARALKKQRLQQDSQRLRDELAQHARGVAPVATAVDAARTGWRWLKAHPMVPVLLVTTVVVAKPALVWRVGKGAWAGWEAWKRWRHLVVPPPSDNAAPINYDAPPNSR